MKVETIVLSEGGILLLVCLAAACWYKSINKIIGSNCTKASCCGMSIERKPLSEEAAIEILNSQPHQSVSQVVLEKIAHDLEKNIVEVPESKA